MFLEEVKDENKIMGCTEEIKDELNEDLYQVQQTMKANNSKKLELGDKIYTDKDLEFIRKFLIDLQDEYYFYILVDENTTINL